MTTDYGKIALDLGKTLAQAPLQVEAQGRVGIDAAALFTYITTIEKLPEWLPFAKRAKSDDSKADVPSGVGSVRMIYAVGNKPTCERVVHYQPSSLYAYSARDADLFGAFTKHLGVISVEPHHVSGAVITWLAYGQPTRFAPLHYAGLRIFAHVLRKGISNLEKRFPAR